MAFQFNKFLRSAGIGLFLILIFSIPAYALEANEYQRLRALKR